MGNGILKLLRTTAVLGMALSTIMFALVLAQELSPENGSRAEFEQVVVTTLGERYSGRDLARGVRRTVRESLAQLQGPSVWFCLAGLLYLGADFQLADRRAKCGETSP